MPYDTKDGVGLLKKAIADADATMFQTERQAAAAALMDAVLEAALKAGCGVPPENPLTGGNSRNVMPPHSQGGSVSITPRVSGIVLRHHQDGSSTDVAPPDIEFDWNSGEWVGTEEDSDVVPTPGQRRPRKNAVTEVLRRVAEVFPRIR